MPHIWIGHSALLPQHTPLPWYCRSSECPWLLVMEAVSYLPWWRNIDPVEVQKFSSAHWLTPYSLYMTIQSSPSWVFQLVTRVYRSLFHHLWQQSFGFGWWSTLQIFQNKTLIWELPGMCANPPKVLVHACFPSCWYPPGHNNCQQLGHKMCKTFSFRTSSSSSRVRFGLKSTSFALSPKASSGVTSLLAL